MAIKIHMRYAVGGAMALAAALTIRGDVAHASPVLRVCADPNNLPFSNDRQQGFENRLATILAADIGARLEYVWWPQRRGFVRNTLDAGACDVVMGVPCGYEMTLTTRPYYRSTYVFVSRRGEQPALTSLNDARLQSLRIGVQMIGDDFANSPPAHSLSARGLIRNIVGYSVLGDYSKPNPPARIIDAVANREVDVALVWGPLAGYFTRRSRTPLEISPILPGNDGPSRPFAFDIAIGVRRGDTARQRILDEFIVRKHQDIDAVLMEFGVPRAEADPPRGAS